MKKLVLKSPPRCKLLYKYDIFCMYLCVLVPTALFVHIRNWKLMFSEFKFGILGH